MDVLLFTGDLVRLTGVRPQEIERWVKEGLLHPKNAHGGHGRHRLFSLGDAVAVAVGMKYREVGAEPRRVAGVLRFLADLGLERLEKEIAKGRTFPAPGAKARSGWFPGVMIDPVQLGELPPNVAALVKKVNLVPVVERIKKAVATEILETNT